jgi:hypothetical protein
MKLWLRLNQTGFYVGRVYASLTFPGKKGKQGPFSTNDYESGPDVKLHLTVFRIGHLILTGISGELMNEIGSAIKTASPYSRNICHYSLQRFQRYICTDKAFPEGGDEVKVTRLMLVLKNFTEKVLEGGFGDGSTHYSRQESIRGSLIPIEFL